jgi:hypothetical protein
MNVGVSPDARWNFTLNFDGPTTIASELNTLGAPLVSSNPLCPIIAWQIFKDEGQGIASQAAQQLAVLEDATKVDSNVIINNELAINKMLHSNPPQRAILVLVGVT